ncbi:hypothetical protein QP027_01370 [Corynebacterium breve]|uniref:Uncharacterized protein n=1 Tax=Corynebacterium breve TaxID=3049799 RepID=A0ABY8VKH9_9CORY|nr:hypothetical protein [Corynebacterium breve]WIM68075.1 hypothetical protein QP027_01370 [Corynebacterium breve]
MTTSGYGAEPRAHPQARGLTILLGIILVGLSTVLGRDLWMALQYEDRRGWLEPVYDFLASFPVGTPAVAGGYRRHACRPLADLDGIRAASSSLCPDEILRLYLDAAGGHRAQVNSHYQVRGWGR